MIPAQYGYHANERIDCEEFLDSFPNVQLILARDAMPWLGRGMYFWDTKANAKFWKAGWKSQDAWIIRALINMNSVLDLLDDEHLEMVEKIWQTVRTRRHNMFHGKYLSENSPVGLKIDILFHDWPELSIYSVIRAAEIRSGKRPQFILGTKGLTTDCRLIYAVKVSSVILSASRVE